jgi:hypothetical protein
MRKSFLIVVNVTLFLIVTAVFCSGINRDNLRGREPITVSESHAGSRVSGKRGIDRRSDSRSGSLASIHSGSVKRRGSRPNGCPGRGQLAASFSHQGQILS